MRLITLFCTTTAVLLLNSGIVAAQNTKTELPAKADAPESPPADNDADDDADDAQGKKASPIDKVRTYVEKKGWVERFSGDSDGFYPRFGGMTTGSGFAPGVGYRRHFGDDVLLDLSGGLSKKLYKVVDARARWVLALDDRLELWTNFRYQDFPQEDFFGLGHTSSEAARSNYALTSTDFVGRGLFHLTPWLDVGMDLGYFQPTISSGTDNTFPSTEHLFSSAQAPGLDAQPDYLHTTWFADADNRDRRGSPTRGGRYFISFARWDDQTLQRFDFNRFDAEASQFFRLIPKHVFGVHGGISYVNNDNGHQVPFYFLPYVGGSDTLRGFEEFRFRDENILYLNGEYRWQVLKLLDIAAFLDAGEVRPDWQDIDLGDLRTSYGIGFRVHNSKATFLRVDIATGGGEGTRLFFKLRPSF